MLYTYNAPLEYVLSLSTLLYQNMVLNKMIITNLTLLMLVGHNLLQERQQQIFSHWDFHNQDFVGRLFLLYYYEFGNNPVITIMDVYVFL